jgi:hypothetical protein
MTKILQFTDLHMRRALPGHNGHVERLGRHIPQLLKALARRVEVEEPDLIVVTGDLVDAPPALLYGEPRDTSHPLVAAAIEDYRRLAAWLESLDRPWMALPGNHDYGPAFGEVFGSQPKQMALGDLVVHAFHDWEQAGNQARRVGEERERFLEIIQTSNGGTREIHLQHYVLHPRIEYPYPLLYGDADELVTVLSQAPGHRLVLSGHWHGGTPLVQSGNVTFSVCPAFCEAPHPYRVYEVEADGACTMRQEYLGNQVTAERLIVVDRSNILTLPKSQGTFALRADAGEIFTSLQAVAPVALASGWFEDESATTKWREIQILNDLLFSSFDVGEEQGAAMAIYLREQDVPRCTLPAEPVATEETMLPRLAKIFGVPVGEVTFLTTDAERRQIALEAGAASPVLGSSPTRDELLTAARTLS